jgi:hypothetical protein
MLYLGTGSILDDRTVLYGTLHAPLLYCMARTGLSLSPLAEVSPYGLDQLTFQRATALSVSAFMEQRPAPLNRQVTLI